MNKVLIVHGLCGTPNGNWKPWLLAELEKLGVYASSIALPHPDNPRVEEWILEIDHQIRLDKNYKITLIGHSLGATAILRYLESPLSQNVSGTILVSGPCKPTQNPAIAEFVDKAFDYPSIKAKAGYIAVFHSDNDPYVPLEHAQILSRELAGELIIVPGAGHFVSASGTFTLPLVLEKLKNTL
jgi:predicted alpha/beta hydrolase family esterase